MYSDARHAIRHRLSAGLPHFRTIVADEWILSGSAAYMLHVVKLRQPSAIAVGIVSPAATVNCDTAWAAGTRGWKDAWGYCYEALLDDQEHVDEERALGAECVCHLGGPGAERLSPPRDVPLPTIAQGDKICVEVSGTHMKMKVPSSTHAMVLCLPPTAKHRPLALALGLKFGRDEVRLWRVEEANFNSQIVTI